MAQTVVDLTLSTIRDLFVGDVKFLFGAGEQVTDVATELPRLQSYLEDVDRKKYDGPIADYYIKEIRRLCYRIEDVVEKYATDVVLQTREGEAENIIDSLKRFLGSFRRCRATLEVGKEINSIKESISELTQQMKNDGFKLGKERSGGGDGKEAWRRKTYGLPAKEDFVGKKKDIELLVVVLLKRDSSEYKVVSIFGMGGLGKTTLAEKIYWHKDIRSGFQAFAWVCVSQNCKPKNIFQVLLEQLSQRKKEATDGMGDEALVEEVYEAMRKQKCLVVLDDLWELDHCKCLEPVFRAAEAYSSKILITTRKESVANIGFFHRLDFLTGDEAWELLRNKAFARTSPEGLVAQEETGRSGWSSERGCKRRRVASGKDLIEEPETFEPLGRQIVRKCGYLPLAISVIGGVLSKNDSLDHWEEVYNKIDLYLGRADESEEEGNIKEVLSLSYDDLPFQLKPCFLYLSLYQEDENIRADELYSMWMAEGIVSPKNQEKEETLMDVAKRYLRELAGRSLVLVEVDEMVAPEKILYCRLHDLVRELCLAKSVEEEFSNLLLDFQGGKRPSLSLSSSNGYLRRLAVYIDQTVGGVSLTGDSTQKLRSLSLHAPRRDGVVFGLPQGLINLENLKFLRVLKFYGLCFPQKEFLDGIGNMVLLRYLGFEGCLLDELPSCIGELPSLQTLELSFNFREDPRMPNVLWKIKRLKCLYIPSRVQVEGKLALSGLDELEILHGFDSRCCEINDLSKLKSLRRLEATISENEELSKFIDCIEAHGMCLEETIVRISNCDFSSVEGMSVLRKLFMSRNIHDLDLFADGRNGNLPEYEPGFLPRLTTLNLRGIGLSEDFMGTLEKLPKLRKLVLWNYFGKKMVCNGKGFPQLRSLALYSLPNLKTWEVEEGAMPRLSFLELSRCDRLDMIPDGIRFIKSLQTLDVEDMPREFQSRVKEGGEDYDKVHHINSIKIYNGPWPAYNDPSCSEPDIDISSCSEPDIDISSFELE